MGLEDGLKGDVVGIGGFVVGDAEGDFYFYKDRGIYFISFLV